ncbi:xanthine dehydrogenase accessory protein XdhC [Paucibacter sp. KBW04]|uniref:xanthine dehydrogenase accessory protein XdhC n=1 Tax=Paucibacter sp. KBW04 TaxID=2153361 RepID=UPI000F563DE4|nr:xanthine dehydrogenase accessory protein XdhC [Paucibacter sp. KBW04]RQO53503.1 xanthine dehydrogenase accessory protein XdhC [Paucibacter sp. KBW04]
MGKSPVDQVLAALADQALVLIQVDRVEGSGPREVGAWMVLGEGFCQGSIGGGQLEFEAMALARELLLQENIAGFSRRFPLGPRLGQCCGGVVTLSFERLPKGAEQSQGQVLRQRLGPAAEGLMSVALFGGGHVGRAIVELLGRLPCRVFWVDSREAVFPPDLPAHVQSECSEPVERAVAEVAPGSQVLIMSFSHAEDLDIVAACLRRQRERGDLAFIGLIGSKSKWASFRQRLLARGFEEAELAQVSCPIGLAGIQGKQPEVIAIAVVAQLLSR